MTGRDESADILLLPVIDVNWLVYAPFDPARGFRVDPPKVEQSIDDTRRIGRILADLTGGKCLLTPHSGTYCRLAYYEGEMLEVYREAVAGGAEVAVHLHEEIKGAGTRYTDEEHVRTMFAACARQLESAGIAPAAYRGGHYAYTPFMNRLLAAQGVHVDCSCAPGADHPEREAVWIHAPTSADYLPENPRLPAEGQAQSSILEIPIGSDGEGAGYRNILHIEQSDDANLRRIWGVVRQRARDQGRQQIVHALFHTASVGRDDWLERFKRFLAWVPGNGGAFVGAREAKAIFDEAATEAAA